MNLKNNKMKKQFLKFIIILFLTNNNLFAQDLITVAQMDIRPGNVTVTANGDIFATIHPFGNHSLQLVKIVKKKYIPFPNKIWQREKNKPASISTFDTPLGITTDSKSNIWIIDIGINYGKTRLFAFDSKTGTKTFELVFPEDVAPKGSFIQDLAVDDKNGFVYLADISNPGILVVNIKNQSVKRIKQHKTFLSEDVDMIIDNKIIQFGEKPARVAINPITLSSDKDTLYYGAMNGKNWYSLSAKLIRENATDYDIENSIKKVSDKPISDGVATDNQGNHYFTNLTENGIDVYDVKSKRLKSLIRNPKLDWPDNVAIGKDNYIYIAVNQLHKTTTFTGAEDSGKAPYYIYKIKK
jgi:sugar lactone lactonase YvrE